MYVLHAWKSSLQIFIPSNFKLFLLVTLKTIISTIKKYLKYGWPFIVAYGFFAGMLLVLNQSEAIIDAIQAGSWFWASVAVLGGVAGLLLYAYCSFLVAIFARPSVDQKNCAYMHAFSKRYFLGYLVLKPLFAFIIGLIIAMSTVLFKAASGAQTLVALPPMLRHFLQVIWYITSMLSVLFYLDLGGSFSSIFKSIWFGIKMVFYNLPFAFVTAVVIMLGARIGDDYLPILAHLHLILYPFLFCFITTLYSKKVHDQARLYQGI